MSHEFTKEQGAIREMAEGLRTGESGVVRGRMGCDEAAAG